jgi:MFS family permease
MSRLSGPIRSTLAALRLALSNDGIRRMAVYWALGIAADTGLLVVLLVVVYLRDGVVAAGVLGAVRMVPAVVSAMLSGALLERFRGDRLMLWIGLIRTAAAALVALVIASNGPSILLYGLAGVVAAAGAPVRPTQATLMPAVARSPSELVAANMTWSTGEGLGSMAGPFIAGLFVAVGRPELGAVAAAVGFLGTVVSVIGLRFEQAKDATGGAGAAAGGIRLNEGVRTIRRRPIVGWSMVGVFAQVMTRAVLGPLAVVAAIELLGMGEGGVGLLNSALGLGGLVGAIFAVSLTRSDRLIRTEAASLFFWGSPIIIIGLLAVPSVALAAMVVVGVANAVFDVALFTLFQRGTTNEERAPFFSVFEGVVGLASVTGSLLAPVLLALFGPSGALVVTGLILPVVALLIYSRIGGIDRVTLVDEATLQLLREVPEFAELPLTAIERLASGLEPVAFEAREALMREGEPGDRFLVLTSGEVEVSAEGRPIQRLGRGAGLGEIALLRRSPRTATVTALMPVTAWAIPGSCFVAAVSGPAAAIVTERIAAANMRRGAAGIPGAAGA